MNPKSRALQYHPTVSPTLHHHIQRKRIKIQPDIKVWILIKLVKFSKKLNTIYCVKEISGNEVTFTNGEKVNFDAIILCTGYKIGIDFLSNDLKQMIFDKDNDAFLNVTLYDTKKNLSRTNTFYVYF